MMNLFEQAIEGGELLNFALGKYEYYIADFEYDEHSVIRSWLNYVLPLIELKGTEYVNSGIDSMFGEIVKNEDISANAKNENLLYHLHTYYYLDSEKRIKAILPVELNASIENSLMEYLDNLKQTDDVKYGPFNNAINLIKSRGGLSRDDLQSM